MGDISIDLADLKWKQDDTKNIYTYINPQT